MPAARRPRRRRRDRCSLALVLLTESRGTVFAFAVSALATIWRCFPGRNRRAWLLLFVLGGLAIAWGPLTDVTQALPAGQSFPAEATIRHGAEWSLLAAGLVALLWGARRWAAALRNRALRLCRREPAADLGGAPGCVVVGRRPRRRRRPPSGTRSARVSDQYDAFTELKPVTERRRDSPRAAATATTTGGSPGRSSPTIPSTASAPATSTATYFLERRTDEDVRQAHSIELADPRRDRPDRRAAARDRLLASSSGSGDGPRRRPSTGGRNRALTVAATGMFLVWLAQTSVDWLHLIPGLTGHRLGGGGDPPPASPAPGRAKACAACRCRRSPSRSSWPSSRSSSSAGRHWRSAPPHRGQRTRSDRIRRAALEEVEESLSLNPDAVQAYYTKAAALARLDAYRPAKARARSRRSSASRTTTSAGPCSVTCRPGAETSPARCAPTAAPRLNPRDKGLRATGLAPRARRTAPRRTRLGGRPGGERRVVIH